MASIVKLIDLTKLSVSGVPLARGSSAKFTTKFNKVQSSPNGRGRRSDPTYAEISAAIAAEDPLGLPLVLAATFPGTLLAGGRKISSSPVAYQDYTLLHALLTGFSFNLADNRVGTMSADFQNRGPSGGSHGVELTAAAGTRQGVIAREGLIRILSASFTDDASVTLAIPGLASVSGQGKALNISVGASPGEGIADLVDVSEGWDISGSLGIDDQSLATSNNVAQQLCALRRGTLEVVCMPSGVTPGATSPASMVLTLDRIKFFDPEVSLAGQREGSTGVGWDIELFDDAGAELDLDDVISAAEGT